VPPRRRARAPVAHAPGSPGGPPPADRLRTALAADDLARAADAAIELGAGARDPLPEALRPGFDAVRDAFAHYEAGRDEAVRERLQAVGLTSPFLDWKLLLRGLLAHAAGDDARALDNWSRLAADRVPAWLAAPLRFALDRDFRAAQPPAAQAALRRQGDRLLGGVVPGLRALQGLLARSDRLADAFRQAEVLLPALRHEFPDLVPRLANVFHWAIVHHGEPEDVAGYRRLFGAPADDPTLARLDALAAEDRRADAAAHRHWQRYEQALADLPGLPPADRDRARALVWCRMGRNAAAREVRLPPPSAEVCFKRAAALAPDLLDAHVQLFQCLRERKRPAQALAAGRRILERFPAHVPTLEALADVSQARGDTGAALDFARRAAAANPLDRRLRGRLADAHRARARALAAAGDFAAARADLDAALGLRDGRPDAGLLAQWATCAWKSGAADAAEERLRQTAGAVPPLAVGYTLAAEAARAKLPRPLKQRFEAAFAAALAGPPTGAAAVALAGAYLDQLRQGGTYLGQKTHEKKVQAFVEAVLKGDPGAVDLARLCERLRDLGWWSLLKKAAARGGKRFPRDPFFPYFEAAAYLGQGRDRGPAWKVEPLLEKARRLLEAAPPDDRLRQLGRDLDAAQRRLAEPSPFINVLNDLFDMFDE
jgi:tetratricopeptide (TPR) repeat protein